MTTDDPPTPSAARLPCVSAEIRFDRQLSIRILVLAVLLSWPLFVFGRPAYFPDSAVYYKGGRAAVRFASDKIMPVRLDPQASLPRRGAYAPAQLKGPDDVAGARSIPYSVTAYLLSGPNLTMGLLAILNIVLVAFAIAVLMAAIDLSNVAFGGVATVLAFATPAAFFASCAMPDIFAGVSIIVIAVMVVYADRLARSVAIPLGLTGSFAIASHPSHIALALVLLPLALAWRFWAQGRRFGRVGNRSPLWVAAPVVLGALATVIGGLVSFGEVSLAPKHFPLTLAREIDDGPARWYLDRHCHELHYVVCRLYPHGLPATATDFLWGANGIRKRANAAQMERLRIEEQEILLATTADYPLQQLTDAIGGTARQLVSFATDEANFNVRIILDPDGQVHLAPDRRLSDQALRWADAVNWMSALIATAAVVIGLIVARGNRQAVAVLLLAGLIANAAICATFSAVDDRYQARVIWLLPLAAIVVLVPARRRVLPTNRRDVRDE